MYNILPVLYTINTIEHIDDHLIIRDVGLNARGKLDRITREIASELDIPHHCGA